MTLVLVLFRVLFRVLGKVFWGRGLAGGVGLVRGSFNGLKVAGSGVAFLVVVGLGGVGLGGAGLGAGGFALTG